MILAKMKFHRYNILLRIQYILWILKSVIQTKYLTLDG